MKRVLDFLLLLCCFAVVSCSKRGRFEVSGTLVGSADRGIAGQTLYLEREDITEVVPVDSVETSRTGMFRFKQRVPDEPSFYRLRWKNHLIHLGVDSARHIVITTDTAHFAIGYTVEGSPVCTDMQVITQKQQEADHRLKELNSAHVAGTLPDTAYRTNALAAIIELKNFLKPYILRSPQSLTAYYALLQRVDNALVFGLYDKADFQLYALVTNVRKLYYPESPRTANLEKLTLQGLVAVKGLVAQPADSSHSHTAQTTGIVNLTLPAIDGQPVALSEYAKSHVTLLDFTAYAAPFSPEHNMFFGELYEKFSGKGLKIYQVSVDKEEHLWKNRAANLPWMCVWAAADVQSQVLMAYNVGQLPTAFVIDREGTIVARVENNRDLELALSRFF